MKVQEDNQTDLTDDLYEKDIEIAEFHKELSAIEKRIHFIRTTTSAAKLQFRNSDKLYYALESEKIELTSMLDWVSDILFYLGESSEDVNSRTLDSYKELRDMDNPVEWESRIDLKMMSEDILELRVDLFRLYDKYQDRVEEIKPVMSIFEILIDRARAAVRKTKTINFYSYA